jgi:F-box/TPR repeat protein Pof3
MIWLQGRYALPGKKANLKKKGYLRLGKIARLQKKHEFAWKVYNAGIDANANASNDAKQLPKVKVCWTPQKTTWTFLKGFFADTPSQQLYAARQPLHARFFRQDPLQLPLDLVQIIFLQLDLPSLV